MSSTPRPTIDFLSDLRWRGQLQQCTHEQELAAHLGSGPAAARRAYAGFDPTADSLTIGNLVPIIALRRWQLAGHTPIVIMGGGTGLIGDPSGKSAERTLRTIEEVNANVASQRTIFDRVLDFSPAAKAAGNAPIVLNNHDWLGKLSYLEALRDIGKHFSVNMMIQKDSVKDRLHNRDQGISYTEFSYMILQAYDYFHLWKDHGVTLQMGGSDQFGNIVVGSDLIKSNRSAVRSEIDGLYWKVIEACEESEEEDLMALAARVRRWSHEDPPPSMSGRLAFEDLPGEVARCKTRKVKDRLRKVRKLEDRTKQPTFGLTWPLVTKADGTKFGKTETGAIWLTAKRGDSDTSTSRTSPYSFYQFWLNTADADVVKFLKTFTFFSHAEIDDLAARHEAAPGQREAHKALAKHMTAMLHGEAELEKVEQATRALFAKSSTDDDGPFILPEDLLSSAPTTSHDRAALAGAGMSLVELLALTSLAKSKSEARTHLGANAISVNGRAAALDARVTEATLLPGDIIALRRGKKSWHITRWA